MKISFSESAFRQLSKFEKNIQKRIMDKLDFYISQNDPLEFSEKLTESQFGQWRYRIGDYRILFDLELRNTKIYGLVEQKHLKTNRFCDPRT